MFVLTFAVWGGGYIFQRSHTRGDTGTKYDWSTKGYVGPMFLYIFYGFYGAAWQTRVFREASLSLNGGWSLLKPARFMGAISNSSRKLANFAGFYKGIQSAGAAIIWRLVALSVSYMNLFTSCWILLAAILIVALPVMILRIKDIVPVEEDLKFTDETSKEVVGYRVMFDSPEQEISHVKYSSEAWEHCCA